MPDVQLAAAPVPGTPQALEISISGDITSANIRRFQEGLTNLLESDIAIPLLLMRTTGSISSAGFTALVDLAERLNRHGGLVILVDPLPKIRLTMDTLGIGPRFLIAPDVPTARTLAEAHVAKLQSAPRLAEAQGTQQGFEYPLINTQIDIGSDPKSTIVLKHPHVDPHHAIVFRTGNECFLRDLLTQSGTYVGKKRITEAPLTSGDIVTIATFHYLFSVPSTQ